MNINNKKKRVKRDPYDPTEKLTISLKQSRVIALENYALDFLGGVSTSFAISHALDQEFSRNNIDVPRVPYKEETIPFETVAAMVGETIDGLVATDCFIRWIDNEGFKDFEIKIGNMRLFRDAVNSLNVKSRPIFDEFCKGLLRSLSEDYFLEKVQHLLTYQLIKHAIINEPYQDIVENLKHRHDGLVLKEYKLIGTVIMYSEKIKFVIAYAFDRGLLKEKCEIPDWHSNDRDALIAMNTPWK